MCLLFAQTCDICLLQVLVTSSEGCWLHHTQWLEENDKKEMSSDSDCDLTWTLWGHSHITASYKRWNDRQKKKKLHKHTKHQRTHIGNSKILSPLMSWYSRECTEQWDVFYVAILNYFLQEYFRFNISYALCSIMLSTTKIHFYFSLYLFKRNKNWGTYNGTEQVQCITVKII